MNLELLKGLRALIFGPLVPILLFVAACGASVTETPPAEVSTPEAPAAAPSPVSTPQEPAATPQQAQTTQEPVATPQEAQVTQEPVSPGGTLNSGMPEMAKFDGHPFLTSEPRQSVVNLAIGEGAVRIKQDLSATPMLAESWEISDDFLTWTFKMREGVQFHKGYGEMTAEDFVYSQNQLAEAGFHARASFIKDFWNHPEGSVEITDTYTVKVNTGEPWVDGRVFEWMADQGGASSWIVSKKQSEEIGVEAASADIAATGPYQIEEHQTGEFWRMSAVQDHWRQTPYFDELVFWEIPEESA